jgi:hypothetical protein
VAARARLRLQLRGADDVPAATAVFKRWKLKLKAQAVVKSSILGSGGGQKM